MAAVLPDVNSVKNFLGYYVIVHPFCQHIFIFSPKVPHVNCKIMIHIAIFLL